jgi:hypothetical protein
MALIDLRTDLKSLKYGKDRIGGGSSNQPFVQKPIPDSFSAVGNTGGLDVLTRGGSLVFQRTADDVSRLTKLLVTGNTFQGPFFTIKQNVLSRQGVQTQASPKGLNEGAYLPTNTLTQVAVSPTGLHFNKQGLNPIPGTPGSLTTYSDIVESSLFNSGIKSIGNNRLIKFTNNFVNSKSSNTLYSYPGGPGSILGLGKTTIQTPTDQRTGINRDNTTSGTITAGVTLGLTDGLYKINGFKDLNSLIGVSVSANLLTDFPGALTATNTLITLKTAPAGTQTAGINFNELSKYARENNLTGSLYIPVTGSESNNGLVPEAFQRISKPTEDTLGQEQGIENLIAYTYTADQLKQAQSYRKTGTVVDFRKQLRTDNKTVGANIQAPDYNTQNIENRVNLGDPGTKGDITDYTDGKKDLITGKKLGPLDKLNALPIYRSQNVKTPSAENPVNDLVKFRIAILDANGGVTKSFIHFRAFLDTVTDNYSAQWDSFKYVGRGENFYTYGGFERSISLGWTVYAQSKEELIPMYKKLNYLASTLAPSYNNGFMQGTFAQLTVGGYIYEMPGIIKSISYELSQEAPWEIGINNDGFENNKGDSTVKELSHMVKVSGFEFIPIPNFLPQRQTQENGPSRFISLSNGANSNYK